MMSERDLAPVFLVRIELKSMGRLDEALEFAQKAARQAYRGWDEGTDAELDEEKNREKARLITNLEPLPARETLSHFYLAEIARASRQPEQAQKHYARALEINGAEPFMMKNIRIRAGQ